MAEVTQTYKNHKRIDPYYHQLGFGLVLVAMVLGTVHLIKAHDAWLLLVAANLLVIFTLVRVYPLRVQDRVIRLEETLRMRDLLPEPLKARIQELKPAQFVALRFAADAELAQRVEEALRENLSGAEIKKRIQTWRPDTFRV